MALAVFLAALGGVFVGVRHTARARQEAHTEVLVARQQIRTQTESIHDMVGELEIQKLELAAANTKLQEQATTDSLTGLKNHRTFQECLQNEFQRSVRYHTPLSIVLLDVDHFKSYNATFGHPAGDRVLKQIAQVLKRTTRSTDVAARYGGEEFMIFLPETDEHGAREMAERLRAAVEAAPWPERSITASIGVATMNLLTSDSSDLIAEAEKALYHTKSTGRNRVRHANEMWSEAILHRSGCTA